MNNPPANSSSPRARRMSRAVLFALAATEAYFFANAHVRDSLHLQLGLVMILFAFVPAWRWAKSGSTSLPVFEVLLFITANTYAFPLLNGHEELLRYSIEDVTNTALQVILFQISAIVVHAMVPTRPGRGAFWQEEVIGPTLSRWVEHGMTISTAYVIISTFTDWIPSSFGSVLRAVFFGIGIICTFITSRRLGQGSLSPGEKLMFFLNLFAQSVAIGATLVLVQAISTILLALVGYVSASGRVPAVVTVVVFGTLAILHNGKSEMRAIYWTPQEQHLPPASTLPQFYSTWFQHGLALSESEPGGKNKMTSKLIERTSLLHILCLVVSNSPQPNPYLEGETYGYIPGQFVPRFFWPEKPPGHVSTSRLSVYYGLQTEEETHRTTIGFGMVAEAYANFGFFGVIGIAAFLAALLKKISGLAEGGPLLSYGGVLMVILLAWSFQVEFTLSLWLSSLYQACLAVLGLCYALRKFIN
ncbi:hypothetical protein CMV30_18055 [Nibricoccus aquaticus]|uniref:O-antigen polymerase n=2 Tax=Nibricoccus aquaticus TaxID=2576891 RepID=A0A290QK28_9BACT|nr:hypothetical protein CMV30_18055 [Nibricoccus aquaticus]